MPTARVRSAAAVASLCATLAACSSSAPPAAAPRSSAATTAAAPSAMVARPSPTVALRASLSDCPTAPVRAASLPVLFRAGAPDDLAVDRSGGLWIADVSAGTVTRVDPSTGAPGTVLRGFSSPEGIVALSASAVLVAEQGRDRVVEVLDGRQAPVPTTLPPSNGALGIDGIAADAARSRFLYPDSPHGTLLAKGLRSTDPLATLATGLGRPVGVVDAGDALYVVAENPAPRGLLRVPLDGGAATPVGSLSQLDDVAARHGLLYVTDLAARMVRAVDPATGEQRVVATGFGQPQGLAVLPDGRLAVADEDAGRVAALPACG